MMKQRLLCLIASLVASACFASSVSQTIIQQNDTTGSSLQFLNRLIANSSDSNQSRLLTLIINPESQQPGDFVVDSSKMNSNMSRLLEIDDAGSIVTPEQTQGSTGGGNTGNFNGQPLFSGRREARKMNLFQGMWRKPKVSPLYLINGTVCRFVDAVPICTTLSTNGLISPGGGGGGGGGGNSSAPRSANQYQPPRASLMDNDDDAAGINLENYGVRAKPSLYASNLVQGFKPANLISRKPLNSLLFMRPNRQLHSSTG